MREESSCAKLKICVFLATVENDIIDIYLGKQLVGLLLFSQLTRLKMETATTITTTTTSAPAGT